MSNSDWEHNTNAKKGAPHSTQSADNTEWMTKRYIYKLEILSNYEGQTEMSSCGKITWTEFKIYHLAIFMCASICCTQTQAFSSIEPFIL